MTGSSTGFPSRRNRVTPVCLQGRRAVKKEYREHRSFLTESRNLTQLLQNGFCTVPRILQREEDVLYLTLLPGTTYADLIPAMESDAALGEAALDALFRFLSAFYARFSCSRGDVNLRNFLFHRGVCYGVDFEEPFTPAPFERDWGEILAYLCTYAPAYTGTRLGLGRALLSRCLSLGADPSGLEAAYQDALRRMLRRRGQAFLPDFRRGRKAYAAMVPRMTDDPLLVNPPKEESP